jgi:hypothetical protein
VIPVPVVGKFTLALAGTEKQSCRKKEYIAAPFHD